MTPEIKNLFAGKMVSDVDVYSMKPSDFKKAVNIRTSRTKGVVTNLLGNKKVDVTLPDGVNETVGSAVSNDDNKIYYINKNSNLIHTIVELDVVSNTCKVILRNITDTFGVDIFNFKEDTQISSARIIDGGDTDVYGNSVNKFLVFVYEGSEPRCINLSRITVHKLVGKSSVLSNGGTSTVSNPFIKKTNSIGYVRIDEHRPWVKVISISDGSITLENSNIISQGVWNDLEYSCFGNLAYEETLLAKAPPIFPPNYEYFTDYNVVSNNLRGDLYQFVYSYEYIDYERSVWSLTSTIRIPVLDEASDGANLSLNNAIKITVNTGARTVRKIHVGYRRLVLSPNDYYEAVIIDKDELGLADNVDYVYNFYNNETTRIIPFSEINNIDYDRIPLEAGCLEVLKNGSIALADVTDGFDVSPVSITGTASLLPISLSTTSTQVLSSAKAASRYKIGVVYGNDSGKRTPVLSYANSIVQTLDQSIAKNRVQNIAWSISGTPPKWATWYSIVATKNLTHRNTYYGVASKLSITDDDPNIVYVYIQNLAGQEKSLGPDYVSYNFTKGDRFKWLKLADSPTYLTETFESEILEDTFVKVTEGTTDVEKRVLKLRKTSMIPMDLFTGTSLSDLSTPPFLFEAYTPKQATDYDNIYFHTANVYPIANPGTDDRTHASPIGIIGASDCFVKTRSIPYTESEVSTVENSIQSSVTLTSQWMAGTQYGEYVIHFDKANDPGNTYNGGSGEYTAAATAKALKVTVKFSGQVDDTYWGGTTPYSSIVIQKYSAGVWSDIGSSRFDALDEYAYGSTQTHAPKVYNNQRVSVSAPVLAGEKIRAIVRHFPGSDRVSMTLYAGATITFSLPKAKTPVEDFNFDDHKNSSLLTLGTPTIVDNSFRRVRRKATILHTDPFIPNTNINGLSRIYVGYFKDYDLNHGAIKRLINRGNYVIAFKESQTTNIPIGMSIISNATGATQLGLSTELLNDEQPYAGQYGLSSNASAIVDTGDNLYLADAMKGKILRLGLDGYDDIGSTAEFSLWISNKLKDYKSGNGIKFAYDMVNKEVLVLFGDETLMYSEDNQGFDSFITMLPEHVAHIGDFSYVFKGGAPYRLNASTNYNEFFGQTYPSSLSVVFNDSNGSGRTYRSLKIWANRLIAPKKLSTDLVTSTYMDASIFEIDSSSDAFKGLSIPTVDGVFIASIPMDENSDGGVIDGTPLRGKILEMELESDLSNSLLSIQAIQINNNQ